MCERDRLASVSGVTQIEVTPEMLSNGVDELEKYSIAELQSALAKAYQVWRDELSSESVNGLPVADAFETRLFQEVCRALRCVKHLEGRQQIR
jgi:hypothetical protein